VEREEAEVKFWLVPVRLDRLVEEQAPLLRRLWLEYFGD